MASKLVIISTVSGTTSTYTVTVDSSTGIQVNDHFSDPTGHIYRASAIAGVSLTNVDDVPPIAPVGLRSWEQTDFSRVVCNCPKYA
jgi:hypothetical protein